MLPEDIEDVANGFTKRMLRSLKDLDYWDKADLAFKRKMVASYMTAVELRKRHAEDTAQAAGNEEAAEESDVDSSSQ